ncbi:MAG: type IX secretion system membrane protein PorP/SprF [Bacteroidales bacterium]|nr:type IX secretion system membrane protein PorP/SprF [Bacteroidales bacterium]MDT8430762.1 type IX secretion system membrane protein PorP/SprF [Bacteroidales bacterium]
MCYRWIILFICLVFAGVNQVKGQQVPLYSQYMLNGFLLNPAIAGAEGYTAVNLTAREQWIGFRDAPGTYALSYQTRILRNSYISKSSSVRKRMRYSSRSGKVGLGGYVFNDRNGAVEKTGLKMSYAYHIFFGNSQLSMGLSLTAMQLRLNDDKIRLEDENDNLWINARGTAFIPDADVGVYFDTPDFYVGFSSDQLLESVIKLGDTGYEQYRQERNYYVMAGYDFPLNNNVVLTPSTLLKLSDNGAFQGDFSTKLYYDQTYWAGLTYRTGNALIVMAGLSIDKFIFGYAFDLSFGSIMKHSFGSHEFIFATKFGDNARRYRWLNRY